MRAGAIYFKIKQYRGTQVNNAMVLDLAKKIRDFITIDAGRACSNRESQENKCRNSTLESADRIHIIQFIYHGYRQGEELL